MPHVALATCHFMPNLVDDEQLGVAALRDIGIDATPVVWDAPNVDWPAFDAVVVRSTWDYYQQKADKYAAWIVSFKSSPGKLWNPPEAILGNLVKTYLVDLAA